MNSSKPRDIEIRHIALALARADIEYRGFEPLWTVLRPLGSLCGNSRLTSNG